LKKYEIHLPLNYQDGKPIEQERIKSVCDELLAVFGSLAVPNRRTWRYERSRHVEIAKIEIITTERIAKKRLTNLRRHLEEYLHQNEISITTHRIQAL
jgi:hypothetical protein